MSTSRVSNERGMALAVAIFALVVIGALVAGAFFAGRLEQSSGQATVYAGQAAEAAEAGLSDAISGVNATTLGAMAIGSTASLGTVTLTGASGLSSTALRRRLTTSLFLVSSARHALERRGRLAGRPQAWHAHSPGVRQHRGQRRFDRAGRCAGRW